jgi:hypothetical protein
MYEWVRSIGGMILTRTSKLQEWRVSCCVIAMTRSEGTWGLYSVCYWGNWYRRTLSSLSSFWMCLLCWPYLGRLHITNSMGIMNKFFALCEAWRIITASTKVGHLSLSWARWIHSTPSQPISLKSILIISYVFVVGTFHQVSPPIPCMHLWYKIV